MKCAPRCDNTLLVQWAGNSHYSLIVEWKIIVVWRVPAPRRVWRRAACGGGRTEQHPQYFLWKIEMNDLSNRWRSDEAGLATRCRCLNRRLTWPPAACIWLVDRGGAGRSQCSHAHKTAADGPSHLNLETLSSLSVRAVAVLASGEVGDSRAPVGPTLQVAALGAVKVSICSS